MRDRIDADPDHGQFARIGPDELRRQQRTVRDNGTVDPQRMDIVDHLLDIRTRQRFASCEVEAADNYRIGYIVDDQFPVFEAKRGHAEPGIALPAPIVAGFGVMEVDHQSVEEVACCCHENQPFPVC